MDDTAPAAPRLARRVADALEAADIPYAIGGAIAYTLYGPLRGTQDVDVNIFIDESDIDRAIDVLETFGEIDREAVKERVRERGDFQFYSGDMRVDVFLPDTPLVVSAGARRRRVDLLGRPIDMLAPEDLILFKLLFHRPKDLTDIKRILALGQTELDHEYIRAWLTEMVGEDDVRVHEWNEMIGKDS